MILRSFRRLLSVMPCVMWRPLIWVFSESQLTGFSMMQAFTERRLQTDFHFRLNVNVTVTVVSYMNSTLRETILPNFLQQWIDLNIFRYETWKYKQSCPFWNKFTDPAFFIFFFHVFLKHKRDMRLLYLLIVFIFLQIHLDFPSRQKAYLKIKVFNKIHFFTLEFIHTCDDCYASICNNCPICL